MVLNNKQKGNAFERKIASELSQWMFNDNKVLKRHFTSGATDKEIYGGDIIPFKQLYDYGWREWPFLIEVKDGYEQFVPTFFSYSKIEEWLIKSVKEMENFHNQNYVILIPRFSHRRTLFFINEKFRTSIIKPELIIPIYIDYEEIYFYQYDFKKLKKTPFNKIWNISVT